jgi:hypothetical protein
MVYLPIDDRRFVPLGGAGMTVNSSSSGNWLASYEFFVWLKQTYSPDWLQPLDESAGSSATSGMAGPDSTSVTSVTFGDPGLVDSSRTAATFSSSRIIFPRGAPLDSIHQAAGGTFMAWVKTDAGFNNQIYSLYVTNGGTSSNVGIFILLDDRTSFSSAFTNAFRVGITRGTLNSYVYTNLTVSGAPQGVVSSTNVIVPGTTQMVAFTHSSTDNLKLYVDGVEVANVAKLNTHSASTSSLNAAVGSISPTSLSNPFVGTMQGLTFIPSILSGSDIADIYDKSKGIW